MGETKAMVYCNASEEVVDVINDDQFEFVVPAPDRGPGQAAAGFHLQRTRSGNNLLRMFPGASAFKRRRSWFGWVPKSLDTGLRRYDGIRGRAQKSEQQLQFDRETAGQPHMLRTTTSSFRRKPESICNQRTAGEVATDVLGHGGFKAPAASLRRRELGT